MKNIALGGQNRHTEEIKALEKQAGVSLTDCYQCGKCSAGCPAASFMDRKPRQLIRLLQLGQYEEALHSNTPWICATCQCCYARCPNEINIPGLMEAVRQDAKRHGIIVDKETECFNELLLGNVKKYGRNHEVTNMGFYNLKTGHLMQDMDNAPKLMLSGKVSLKPHKIKDKAAVKRIFTKTVEKEGK